MELENTMVDSTHDPSERMNNPETLRALFGPTILQILVAITIPEDVLSRYPKLNDIVHVAVEIIPGMQGYINNSTVPDVTAIFLICAWLFFPIHVGLLALELRRHGAYSRIASLSAHSGRYGMEKTILKVIAATLLCGYGLLFLPNDPSFIGRLGMNSSRLGLAVFGSCCFFTFSLCTSLGIYLVSYRIGRPHV